MTKILNLFHVFFALLMHKSSRTVQTPYPPVLSVQIMLSVMMLEA